MIATLAEEFTLTRRVVVPEHGRVSAKIFRKRQYSLGDQVVVALRHQLDPHGAGGLLGLLPLLLGHGNKATLHQQRPAHRRHGH